ncbi:type II secretion system protein GspG [Clostridium lundense]|uniref:type II secretion system protein GspG n=1 Tax=Clostridium lundense TaxID=319475 RepID=UPI000487ED33|nr:type II secretion system protein GspG [Clostridium lundense]
MGKKIKKGFTLVELLVVIAIIAILAAIIAPNAFKAIEKSKVATIESDYKAIKTATLSYYADTGRWPDNSDNRGSDPGLVKEPKDGVDGWNGPYIEKWPNKNPWGQKYLFLSNVTNGTGETWIRMYNVPKKAVDRIKADLNGGNEIVRGDEKCLDLIISEQ